MSKDSQEKKIFRIHKISAAGGEKKRTGSMDFRAQRGEQKTPRSGRTNPSHAVERDWELAPVPSPKFNLVNTRILHIFSL